MGRKGLRRLLAPALLLTFFAVAATGVPRRDSPSIAGAAPIQPPTQGRSAFRTRLPPFRASERLGASLGAVPSQLGTTRGGGVGRPAATQRRFVRSCAFRNRQFGLRLRAHLRRQLLSPALRGSGRVEPGAGLPGALPERGDGALHACRSGGRSTRRRAPDGARYTSQPNALRFQQSYEESCPAGVPPELGGRAVGGGSEIRPQERA